MKGEPPNREIDHIDRNSSNSKWNNFRLATRGQNQANTNIYRNNKSGFKGVHFVPRLNKWRAMISVDGKNRHIGFFSSKEEAGSARLIHAKQAFGEFAIS